MKRIVFILIFVLLAGSGCTTVSPRPSLTLVGVPHHMHATGVSGNSYGLRLFGLIPLTLPSRKNALDSAYESGGVQPGDPKYVLINGTEERTASWFVLASVSVLNIQGDLVALDQPQKVTAIPRDTALQMSGSARQVALQAPAAATQHEMQVQDDSGAALRQ